MKRFMAASAAIVFTLTGFGGIAAAEGNAKKAEIVTIGRLRTLSSMAGTADELIRLSDLYAIRHPKDTEAHWMRFQALRELGRTEEALATLRNIYEKEA